MQSNTKTSPTNERDDDKTTRWAFNFFVGTLVFALLAALWMLGQAALG